MSLSIIRKIKKKEREEKTIQPKYGKPDSYGLLLDVKGGFVATGKALK